MSWDEWKWFMKHSYTYMQPVGFLGHLVFLCRFPFAAYTYYNIIIEAKDE